MILKALSDTNIERWLLLVALPIFLHILIGVAGSSDISPAQRSRDDNQIGGTEEYTTSYGGPISAAIFGYWIILSVYLYFVAGIGFAAIYLVAGWYFGLGLGSTIIKSSVTKYLMYHYKFYVAALGLLLAGDVIYIVSAHP